MSDFVGGWVVLLGVMKGDTRSLDSGCMWLAE